jgi:hypothetical protein
MMDLTSSEFTGANLSITVKRSAVGDGQSSIGFIDARGVDLGSVSLSGDLGRIIAGDENRATTGLNKLKVTTFGRFGSATQPPNDRSLVSEISGEVSRITVQQDITSVEIAALGIDSLFVGGSVYGTNADAVRISGAGIVGESRVVLGEIRVIGDVTGAEILAGYGPNRTPVSGLARIGAVTIGGDWRASSISAGILPGPGGYFGAVESVYIGDFSRTPNNGINYVRIDGVAEGTAADGDHFGILAANIGRIQINGRLLVKAIVPVGHTDDFEIHAY